MKKSIKSFASRFIAASFIAGILLFLTITLPITYTVYVFFGMDLTDKIPGPWNK